MADESELNELRERIGQLPFGQQLHLFEMALAAHRRKCEEAEANLVREIEAQREGERRFGTAGGERAAG